VLKMTAPFEGYVRVGGFGKTLKNNFGKILRMSFLLLYLLLNLFG
jgi:hypothetical protein